MSDNLRHHMPALRVMCDEPVHPRPVVVATFRRHPDPEVGWRWDKHPATAAVEGQRFVNERTEPKRVVRPLEWGRYQLTCRCGLEFRRGLDRFADELEKMHNAGMCEVRLRALVAMMTKR